MLNTGLDMLSPKAFGEGETKQVAPNTSEEDTSFSEFVAIAQTLTDDAETVVPKLSELKAGPDGGDEAALVQAPVLGSTDIDVKLAGTAPPPEGTDLIKTQLGAPATVQENDTLVGAVSKADITQGAASLTDTAASPEAETLEARPHTDVDHEKLAATADTAVETAPKAEHISAKAELTQAQTTPTTETDAELPAKLDQTDRQQASDTAQIAIKDAPDLDTPKLGIADTKATAKLDSAAATSTSTPLAIASPALVVSTAAPGASAAAPASLQTPQITAAPADIPAIVSNSLSGDDRPKQVTVQLDPPELGRVTLDFKLDQDGVQSVIVTAETPDAVKRLRLLNFELIQALQNNGLDGQNFSLEYNEFAQQDQNAASADTGMERENEGEPPSTMPLNMAAMNKMKDSASGLNLKL